MRESTKVWAAVRFARSWQVTVPAGVLAVAMTLTGCNDSDPDAGGGIEANVGAPAQAADDAVVLTGDEAAAAVEAGEAEPYPLDVCVVSGSLVGSMGSEAPMVYNGQEIKFCCPGCDKMFLEAPETYLSKLEAGDAPSEAESHDHSDHDHGHDHDHDHG